MSVASAIKTVGVCGYAFIQAILTIAGVRDAVRALIVYEIAALDQAIAAGLVELQKLDVISRFANIIGGIIREQSGELDRLVGIVAEALQEFRACPAVNVIAEWVEKSDSASSKTVSTILSTTLGIPIKIGDVSNFFYEVSRRTLIRNFTSKRVTEMQEQRKKLLAFLEIYDA